MVNILYVFKLVSFYFLTLARFSPMWEHQITLHQRYYSKKDTEKSAIGGRLE